MTANTTTPPAARRREALRVSTFIAGGIALTLGLAGCSGYTAPSNESVKTCVDSKSNKVADDSKCDTPTTGAHGGMYGWRYYNNGYVPSAGESTTAKGATPLTAPRAGTSTVKGSTVSRGGFGAGKGSIGG
jgi:hypothetical protein